MKAITIIQPFAELIASRKKRVENRRWWCGYRGPLLIHAGKARTYMGEDVFEIADDYEVSAGALLFGAIIAMADMIDCVTLIDGRTVPLAAAKRHPWLSEHDHTEGPHCFILDNIRRLREPIEMSGKQGLFDVQIDIGALVAT